MFFAKRIRNATCKKLKAPLKLDINNLGSDFLRQRNVQKAGNSLLSTVGFEFSGWEDHIYRAVFGTKGNIALLIAEAGVQFFTDPNTVFGLTKETKNNVIGHVSYQDRVYYSSSAGLYYTADGKLGVKINTDYFPSLALCNDRIFGVNGNVLAMSSVGDGSIWDDTLTITAHTELDAVVSLDKLYVLGDTCYTLTPNAEEINIKFVPFCYGIGKVQVESVAQCEKHVIFASTNGLYKLTSNTVTPIFTKLNEYINFDGCVACMHQGKYYVTCKRRDGDMMQNDVMLVLDVDSERIVGVLDVNMQHINSINGKLYAVCDTRMYVASDIDVESCYVDTVDFASSNVKYLDKLAIRTKTDVDVWIDNGNEKRRYHVAGKNILQRVPLAGSGRQFTVEVQAPNGLKLDSVELTARTYEV